MFALFEMGWMRLAGVFLSLDDAKAAWRPHHCIYEGDLLGGFFVADLKKGRLV